MLKLEGKKTANGVRHINRKATQMCGINWKNSNILSKKTIFLKRNNEEQRKHQPELPADALTVTSSHHMSWWRRAQRTYVDVDSSAMPAHLRVTSHYFR